MKQSSGSEVLCTLEAVQFALVLVNNHQAVQNSNFERTNPLFAASYRLMVSGLTSLVPVGLG